MKISIQQLHEIFLSSIGVSTDTRKIGEGNIFFALKGENFNGNTFALKAIEQGAAYAVVDEQIVNANEKIIEVDNCLTALQNLATYHRDTFDIPVFAITGSNGKTTTKELVAAVLSQKRKTLFTQGNLNNHIGVPLTLLQLKKEHEIAVIEMGANHKGEIDLLCNIAHPTHGLITNVGKAHLEGFGGFEGVIEGKTELFRYLIKNKEAIFCNYDNPYLKPLVDDYFPVLYYGTSDESFFSGKIISETPFLTVEWGKKSSAEKKVTKTQLTGAYNFENILAAIRIGNYFGIPDEDIKNAIENYVPSNQRSQIIKIGSNTIILDAYNANPTSMEAALKNLNENYSGKKIILLGDMFELGEASASEHQHIFLLATSINPEELILVGPEFKSADKKNAAIHFDSSEKAKEFLKSKKYTDSTILIKGSRGSKMEKVLEAFTESA